MHIKHVANFTHPQFTPPEMVRRCFTSAWSPTSLVCQGTLCIEIYLPDSDIVIAYVQLSQLHIFTYPNPPMYTLHISQGHLRGLHFLINDLNFDKLPNSCISLGN